MSWCFHNLFQGPSSKDSESFKEVINLDKPTDKQHGALSACFQHRRPTSTVKADIVESSVLDTEPLPKQETSTASLKSCPFKKGNFLTLLLKNVAIFHDWSFFSILTIVSHNEQMLI